MATADNNSVEAEINVAKPNLRCWPKGDITLHVRSKISDTVKGLLISQGSVNIGDCKETYHRRGLFTSQLIRIKNHGFLVL